MMVFMPLVWFCLVLKRQSPTTVFLKTNLTRTITQDKQLILISSHHLPWVYFVVFFRWNNKKRVILKELTVRVSAMKRGRWHHVVVSFIPPSLSTAEEALQPERESTVSTKVSIPTIQYVPKIPSDKTLYADLSCLLPYESVFLCFGIHCSGYIEKRTDNSSC